MMNIRKAYRSLTKNPVKAIVRFIRYLRLSNTFTKVVQCCVCIGVMLFLINVFSLSSATGSSEPTSVNKDNIIQMSSETQKPASDKEYEVRKAELDKREQQIKEALQKLEEREYALSQGSKPKIVEEPAAPLSSSDIAKALEAIEDKSLVMKEASKWFWSEINRIQNPTDCQSAKYMYCPIFNNCGAGCVLHQTIYCFLVGLANGRVTIVGDGWNYLRECPNPGKWECLFKPVSTCTLSTTNAPTWSKIEEQKGTPVTQVGSFSRAFMSSPNFHPWAATDGHHTNTPFWLPPEIAHFLKLHHSDPRVWVVGHLARYLLRLNDDTSKKFNEINANLTTKWTHPIAGVHVRRTDHRVEAPYRELKEYMEHVDRWYTCSNYKGRRRVYLATDEPKVIAEALENYKQYDWLFHDYQGVVSGSVKANTHDRTSMQATLAVLSDWFFLSQTDYLVGTSSSQVTRMSYELMNPYQYDAKQLYVSLDDPWYFP